MHPKGEGRAAAGFSLIELLIVLAVVAVLAAVAVPQYARYLDRSRLITAQADLELLALRLENRYQRLLAYPSAALDDTAAVRSVIVGWVPASEATEFAFSSTDASTSTYTINATGLGRGVAGCVVSLTHSGTKTISGCDELSRDGKWL